MSAPRPEPTRLDRARSSALAERSRGPAGPRVRSAKAYLAPAGPPRSRRSVSAGNRSAGDAAERGSPVQDGRGMINSGPARTRSRRRKLVPRTGEPRCGRSEFPARPGWRSGASWPAGTEGLATSVRPTRPESGPALHCSGRGRRRLDGGAGAAGTASADPGHQPSYIDRRRHARRSHRRAIMIPASAMHWSTSQSRDRPGVVRGVGTVPDRGWLAMRFVPARPGRRLPRRDGVDRAPAVRAAPTQPPAGAAAAAVNAVVVPGTDRPWPMVVPATRCGTQASSMAAPLQPPRGRLTLDGTAT